MWLVIYVTTFSTPTPLIIEFLFLDLIAIHGSKTKGDTSVSKQSVPFTIDIKLSGNFILYIKFCEINNSIPTFFQKLWKITSDLLKVNKSATFYEINPLQIC